MSRDHTNDIFALEELEPRVMLSADFGAAAAALGGAAHHLHGLHETVHAHHHEQSSTSVSDVFAGLDQAPAAPTPPPSATPETSATQPTETTQVRQNTATPAVATSNVSAAAVAQFTATSTGQMGNKAQELTQTLKGANSPPQSQLSQDLLGYINDLIGSLTGNQGATFTESESLGTVSVGGVLQLTGVTLGGTLTLGSSGWSGSITISATSAALFPGNSFSASIATSDGSAAITGSVAISSSTSGVATLGLSKSATMTLTIGEALSIVATGNSTDGVSFSYDPNGAANQTIATIPQAVVSSADFSGFTPATLNNFVVRADGFSFSGFTMSATAPGIANVVTADSATLNVTDFNVTFGYGSTPASIISGSVSLTLTNLHLYPTDSIVQLSDTSVTATYDFSGFNGTNTTGALSIDIKGFQLGMGEALQITTTDGSDVILTPGQAQMGEITAATITSPQFASFGSLKITDLALNQTGFTLGSATWTSAGAVSVGVFQASSVTLTLSNFSFVYGNTPSISGSISVTAADSVLFPTVSLLDLKLGTLSGTYSFGDPVSPVLNLSVPSFTISLGDAFTISLGSVTIAPAEGTILSATTQGTTPAATVTANLFTGLAPITLSSFTLTDTGFSLTGLDFKSSGPVTIGSFLSLSSLEVDVTSFAVSTTSGVSANIAFTFGTLTLFPGSSLITSTFTNLNGSYAFGSSTSPGQFTFTADSFSLTIDGEITVGGNTLTITPGSSTLISLTTGTVSFPLLDGLQLTVNGLQIMQTGFSIDSATATFTSDFTLGSILDLQTPTITLTSLSYTFGGSLSGTVGFSSNGVTLDLGGALTASTGLVTGAYDLSSGTFAATLSTFSFTLANFANLGASSISLSYTPAGDGSATFLIGATGINAFVGVGSGSSQEGVSISGGTLALAVFKSTTGTVTYAFDANGGAALVGLPSGITVAAGNLDVRSNTAGAVNTSINVGGTAVALTFTNNGNSAFATGLTLTVGTYVSITGNFAFSQFTSGSSTYILIAADTVNATFAVGGVSVTMVGGSLSLLVQAGGSSATNYDLIANGGTDALKGVPDVTLTASGLTLQVRSGLDPGTVTGIPSITTPEGSITPDFSSLAGATTSLTDLEGTITLAITNFVSIRGSFGFQATTDGSTTFLAIGASGLTIVLGTATTNITVANASLGLIVEPGTGGNAATFALEAKGSSTPSDTSLNGVTGLTLNGSDIEVLVRQGLDVTATGVPNSVTTPGGTVNLSDMPAGTSNLAVVLGNITLSVQGFGSIQGDFGFQSYIDGQTSQSEIAIGATNTTVVLGNSTTNLTVSGASLALLIRPASGTGSTATPTEYALEATASSAQLNGVSTDFANLQATNIIVRIRNGLDLSTDSGFPTTVETSGGNADLDFADLPAGSSTLIDVEATVSLNIGSFVSISGNFGFQATTISGANWLEFGGTDISVTLGAGSVQLSLIDATLGVVVEQGTGYAVEVIGSSAAADPTSSAPTVALTGITGLTLNATGLYVLARNGLDASALPSGLPATIHTTGGDVSVAFAALGSGSGTLDEVEGTLTLGISGFASVTGNFGIEKFTDGNSHSDLAIIADNVNAVVGTSQLNVTVTGASLSLLISGSNYALEANGGTDSLTGVPDLSLSSTGLKVLIENGLNPATVTGFTPIGVQGSGTALSLNLSDLGTTNITQVSGTISITIANFASISGSFTFTESTSGTVTTILVGASNVTATVGSGTFNIQVSGGSFGLAMYRDSTESGSTYALSASATTILLNGLPSDIALGLTDFTISINTTGTALTQNIPGGENLSFTGAANIKSFGGDLTLTIGSDPAFLEVSGAFSFSSVGTGDAAEILIGASGVTSTSPVLDDSGVSFNISQGTLGLVLFQSGGYAMTATAMATASVEGAAASGTITIRRNTTPLGQNVDVPVGGTVVPVVFADNTEAASGMSAPYTPYDQVIVGNASLEIDNTILITAKKGTDTTDEIASTAVGDTLALTSVTIELTDGAAAPGPSDILITISATSASFTTFSAAVTAAEAGTAGLSAPVNTSGSWAKGDEDLILTNVSFSIAGDVTFTAASIDLQHFTQGAATIDNFAFNTALISFTAGSQQLLSLGGSPTFQYSTTDGFKLTSFTDPTFSFLGQTILRSGGQIAQPQFVTSGSSTIHSDATLGPLSLTGPGISVGGFSFAFPSGGSLTATLSATVTISATSATLGTSALSAAISGSKDGTTPGISGSFAVNLGINLGDLTGAPSLSFSNFTLSAYSVSISIGSFLTLSAQNVQINPGATASQNLLHFDTLTATLNAGGISLSGSASHFDIEGDGSFVAESDFSVSLSLGNGSGTGLPSWLPLQSATVSVAWTDFTNHPDQYTITISALVSISNFEGIPGFSISGSITGLVIDPSLAAAGSFPITSISSFSISASGNVFGGQLTGSIILGIARFDSNGNLVDANNNLVSTGQPGTGPFTGVVYGGLQASFSIGGMGGFGIMIGLSDLGPLDIYIDANVPIPIGDTGLFISNLSAGIEFDASFPTVNITGNASDALQLEQPAFNAPGNLTGPQWQAQLLTQVQTQYKADAGLTPAQAWANFGNGPLLIEAGGSIYAGSADAFEITGNIIISLGGSTDSASPDYNPTMGNFLIIGSATVGGELTVGVKMYADLSALFTAPAPAAPTVSDPAPSTVADVQVSVLFLMQVPLETTPNPNPPPVYQIYGEVVFNYNASTGVMQLTIAGEADFNIDNGVEAEVAAKLTLTFTSNSFNITLDQATLTIPQIQSDALGTASGTLTIENDNGTTNVWGGMLITPNLDGLHPMGIYASGQAYIKINTTNETKTVNLTNGTLTLNPDSFELFLTGTADVYLGSATGGTPVKAFELSGTLDFQIDSTSITLFVDASLLLGPNSSSPLLTFNATGLLYIQTSGNVGVAAKLTLTMGSSEPQASVSYGLNFVLVINTLGTDVTYYIPAPVAPTGTIPSPAGVPTVMGPDYSNLTNVLAMTSYETTVNGQRALVIPGGAPGTGLTSYATWTYTTAGPYLIILGRGNMTIASSFALSGSINILATWGSSGFSFELDANVSLVLSANGSPIFTFAAAGDLDISNAGVAAYFTLSPPSLAGGLGFSFNRPTFTLELNTTGAPVTVGGHSLPTGPNNTFFAEVEVTGDLDLLNGVVDFNGTFDITVTGGSLSLSINANITFLGATFSASGFAAIYYDSHPGLALYIQLGLPGGAQGVAPVQALGSNFVISGTFTLELNTTGITRYDNSGHTIYNGFSVAVTNLGVYLFGFNLTGSLSISISSSGFTVNVQNLSLDLFGLATISLSGYYNSASGQFSFTGSAGFNFGDSTFGMGGTITVTISNSGFSASVSGWAAAFGLDVNATGSITISGTSVDIYVGVYVTIPAVNIDTPAVTISLPWWLGGGTHTIIPAIHIHTPSYQVGGTADFHLGSTSPAPSVAAYNPPPPPPQPPVLAGVSNGVLTLYIGADVGLRVNPQGVETGAQTAEDYSLSLVSTSGNAETIQITALGFTQQYTGVTSIVIPDTQTGNDTVTMTGGIAVPVSLTLGAGNNTITAGSGAGTVAINGPGANNVQVGTGSAITVTGGGSNIIAAGSGSSVSILGNGANNVTVSGGSAPITVSGNGNNSINVENGGSETITISGTGGNRLSVTGGSPTVDVTSAASGANNLTINTSGNASVNVAGAGNNQVGLSGTGAPTVTLTGSGTDSVGTGAGFATVYDESLGDTTVTGGSGGGKYIGGVTSVNGSAYSSKVSASVSTSYGNFAIQVSGYSSYTLSNSSLSFGDFSMSLNGVVQATVTATSIGANTFVLYGWTGSATQINGAGSNNTLSYYPAGNVTGLSYTLTNSELTASSPSFSATQNIGLSSIQSVNLGGAGTGNNSYTVSGWTGTGSISGPSGSTNTLIASGSTSYTLTDISLDRSGAGTLSLNNIQSATLTGASSATTFNVGTVGSGGTINAWSGSVTLSGVSGSDTFNLVLPGTNTGQINIAESHPGAANTVNITGPKNFFVTNSTVKEGTQAVAYSGIGTLNLTGTVASAINYYVQSTSGSVTTTVNADGGTVSVGTNAGKTPVTPGALSGIAGALQVNNAVLLTLDSTGIVANQSGTVTNTTVGGFGMGTGGIGYASIGTLILNLGNGANTVTLTNINAATKTEINAGSSSNDTINATFTSDLDGELDLTGFEHGIVTVDGNLNGTLNDSTPGHLETVLVKGAINSTGRLNAGGIDSLTVDQNLAGNVVVTNTLGNLAVTGSVSGNVSETGTIASLSVGSLASTGTINAVNPADGTQYSAGSLGDITSATIAGGDLAGRLNVSGNVGSLTVDGNLSGTVKVQGSVAELSTTGDVSGSVTETGPITLLSIAGNLAATGTITAVSTSPITASIATFNIGQSLAGLVTVSGDIVTMSVGTTSANALSGTIHDGLGIGTLDVTGTLSGAVAVSNGSIGTLADTGDVTGTVSTPAGSISTMTVTGNLSGQVTVFGNLGSLTVGTLGASDLLSGLVTVGQTLTTLQVNGDVSGQVSETGTTATVGITGSIDASGLIKAFNTDPSQVPVSGPLTTVANITTMTVGGNVAGTLTVTGNVGSLSVTGSVSGTISVGNTLSSLSVGGDVSGSVTESGPIAALSIGGSITSTGTVLARNTNDSSQVVVSQVDLASITQMTVGRNIAGHLTVTGNVSSLSVGTAGSGDSISGTVAINGNLTTLLVTGDVAGTLTESGLINSATITGNVTGKITASNTQDVTQIPLAGPVATLADIATMTVGGTISGTLAVTGNINSLGVTGSISGTVAVANTLSSLTVGGDVSGSVTESGVIATLTINGSITSSGTVTAKDTNDSSQLVAAQVALASITQMTVGQNIAGHFTVTGNVSSLTVGTAGAGDSISGTVAINGALTTLAVYGDISGSVTESGTITTLTVAGNVTATGTITAYNSADPVQLPSISGAQVPVATGTVANITTLSVFGNFAGILTVSGSVITFEVGLTTNAGAVVQASSLSGQVTVQGAITALTVTGDITGTGNITESGVINALMIDGSLDAGGVIQVINTNDPLYVHSQTSDGAIVAFTIGGNLAGTVLVSGTVTTLTVGGNVSGLLIEHGIINLLSITGSITPTGTISATNWADPSQVPSTPVPATFANINTMTVGGDIAGHLSVTGAVTALTVTGNISGTVFVQGTLSTLTVTGDVSGSVTESGIVTKLAITGNLTATGEITAENNLDSIQLPTSGATTVAVPTATYANIVTLTINGNLAGALAVSGSVTTMTVGVTGSEISTISGTVKIQSYLTTLTVTGDISGTVAESGTVKTLTLGGSLDATGIVDAINSNDPYYVHTQTSDGNINTFTIGGGLAGTVLVSSTLTTLQVTGDVSGTVTETGIINLLTIGGNLTATGKITASNWADPVQLPLSGANRTPVPAKTYANVATFTVNGNLAGTVAVSGSVTTLTVGVGSLASVTEASDLSGTVTIQGTLTTLLVTHDVSGSLSESGTINSLTIVHSETVTGNIRADNSNDPYYVTGSATNYGAITTLTIGQDFAGTIFVSGSIGTFTILNGQMAATATLTIGGNLGTLIIGPSHLSVGQNMAGLLNVHGTLTTLQVAGGTPGVIIAGHIGSIGVYGGFGPIVLNVTENGIQRLVDATPLTNEYPAPYAPTADPYAVPTAATPYINIQFLYESGTLANPQLTARVTNNVSTSADQFDFSLITYNDTAKFNLARLDANGVSGIGNVVVEGDLLTAVTAKASAFFGTTEVQPTLPRNELPNGVSYPIAGGVILPNDNLIGVSVRDYAPDDSVEANSIMGLSFGSYKANNGQIYSGFYAGANDAQGILAPGTTITQASGTFRIAFADLPTQQVAFYFDSQPDNNSILAPGNHFDNNAVLFAVQSLVTANATGTANIVTQSNVARGAATALVNILPDYDPNSGHNQGSFIQTVAFNGDGASIATNQWVVQSITSTGPLGDVYIGANQGITDITAPSIFGSIASNGPITGTIQTTGQRTDPITGAVTTVAADIGSTFVVPSSYPINGTPWPFGPFSPFYLGLGFPALPGFLGLPGFFGTPWYPYAPGFHPNQPYVVSTVIYGNGGVNGGISGQIIDRGNMLSEIGSNNGVTGLIAIQGDLGEYQATIWGTYRFGGLDVNGQLNGTVIVLGQEVGDVTINGGLKQGAQYLVEGAVLGNITINGGLDSSSDLIFGSSVGLASAGTDLTFNGNNAGIIAAYGTILWGKTHLSGYIFSNLGATPTSASTVAFLSIYQLGGSLLKLDIAPFDLQGLQHMLLSLDNLAVKSGVLATATTPTIPSTTLTDNFNNTAIPAGDTIWFSSVVNVSQFGNAPGVSIYFSASTITFTNPTTKAVVTISVPAAEIDFSPDTTTAVSTIFNTATNTWVTTVPENYNGSVFLTGAAYTVPSTLAGNIKNVTWTGTFSSNTVGLDVQWQTGEAVYTKFSTNYNALGITPIQLTGPGLLFGTPEAAGSPVDYLSYVTGGAGGASKGNYTGLTGPAANIDPLDDLVDP